MVNPQAIRDIAPKSANVAQRVLFARVGWMTFYRGVQSDDTRPLGAGKYNRTGIGAEVSNFLPLRGKLYGFIQNVREAGPNLRRIDPTANADRLSNVLVIFVSPRPADSRLVVVGWYRRATVFAGHREHPRRRANTTYTSVSAADDAVLLPNRARVFQIPQGAGAFGQANVCYATDTDGHAKPWAKKAITYVLGYKGPNILSDPTIEVENRAADVAERSLSAAGQGFAGTAADRQALEELAMRRARSYLRRNGFAGIRDVSKDGAFDFICWKRTRRVHVEVKGTTSKGDQVIVTRREVQSARASRSALYVLHSVRVIAGKASGGREAFEAAWRPAEASLTPIAYFYTTKR